MENAIREFWLENAELTLRSDVEKYSVFTAESIGFITAPRLQCADGFTMSVQASYTHYCSPRDYLRTGNYASWEVGFPSQPDELLTQYAEDESNPTGTVYGYVQTAVINAVIAKHGGLVGPQLSSAKATGAA